MPRKPRTHNRADVLAAIKLVKGLGKTVLGLTFLPDGAFKLDIASHRPAPPTNGTAATDFDEWIASHADKA